MRRVTAGSAERAVSSVDAVNCRGFELLKRVRAARAAKKRKCEQFVSFLFDGLAGEAGDASYFTARWRSAASLDGHGQLAGCCGFGTNHLKSQHYPEDAVIARLLDHFLRVASGFRHWECVYLHDGAKIHS